MYIQLTFMYETFLVFLHTNYIAGEMHISCIRDPRITHKKYDATYNLNVSNTMCN